MLNEVRREQRFTADRPCPVCGGHDRLPRGEGERCHGFLSRDGRYAHCGREDHAGGLPVDRAGTYAHRLDGPCRCGASHGDEPPARNGARPTVRVGAKGRQRRAERIVAAYDYVDADGAVRFQVVRYEPKRFGQRRPDGGGWAWSLEGVERIPYRLPQVLAAKPGRAVWLCEGEKDADRLTDLGLVATTTAQGARSFALTDVSALADRSVVILPHNDDDGRRYAEAARCALIGLGCRVKVVALPGLPPGGDVSDWIDAGGTVTELNRIALDTPLADGACEGTAEPETGDEARPRLNAGRDDFPELAPICWTAMQQRNEPPFLFVQAGEPIRLDPDPATSGVRVVSLDEDRFGHELGHAIRWVKTVKIGGERIEVDSSPRAGLVRNLLSSRSLPFPVLERIVRAPMFGGDGSLQTEAGYHSASRTYYTGELSIDPVPSDPSDREVADALLFLVDELFGDFPFVKASDLAHALGELLLPFVRSLINGPCPLHVHEAPTQGTGKDLLAEAMCRVVTGEDPATLNYSDRSEEFGKRVVSTLRPMPEWVVIPNVSGVVNNEDLTDLISRGEHQGRLLGASTMLRLPARNVWTLTSNNAQLTSDMVRRSVRIRIDARMARPEQRRDFRHPELKGWIDENRGQLVWACLTLVRSWIRAEQPAGTAILGGFGRWARVVGGIVAHVGCDGFLADRDEFVAQADVASADERAFVALWWEKRGPTPCGVSDLYPFAIDENVNLDIAANSPRGERTRLGVRLRQMRDRRYRIDDGVVIVGIAGVEHQATLWKLTREDPDETP